MVTLEDERPPPSIRCAIRAGEGDVEVKMESEREKFIDLFSTAVSSGARAIPYRREARGLQPASLSSNLNRSKILARFHFARCSGLESALHRRRDISWRATKVRGHGPE